MRKLLFFFLAFVLFSCKESRQHQIATLINAWEGRSIYYPVDSMFESFNQGFVRKYSLKHTEYTIVTYLDSFDCKNNMLRLTEWKNILNSLKPYADGKVTCLFFFHPENREKLICLLKQEQFNYPVCIDEDDIFNKLNRFPPDKMFQTFLVDKDNKVLAMGNPAADPSIKERYFNIIKASLQSSPKERE